MMMVMMMMIKTIIILFDRFNNAEFFVPGFPELSVGLPSHVLNKKLLYLVIVTTFYGINPVRAS
jgi:hypothetical protein